MGEIITLAGQQVLREGPQLKVNGRVATPNGFADAVFEGGGVKGIGHIGALAYAESIGIQWVNVAGTSAGAIVAALVAAGYTSGEIKGIMDDLDFNQFRDEDIWDRVPVVGKAISLIAEKRNL